MLMLCLFLMLSPVQFYSILLYYRSFQSMTQNWVHLRLADSNLLALSPSCEVKCSLWLHHCHYEGIKCAKWDVTSNVSSFHGYQCRFLTHPEQTLWKSAGSPLVPGQPRASSKFTCCGASMLQPKCLSDCLTTEIENPSSNNSASVGKTWHLDFRCSGSG